MERSRKLVLTNWSKANTALQKYFEGNKSKLAQERKVSRTTITAFFKCEPVSEAKFRKIAFGLHLNEQDWQIYSDAESAPKQEDWIEEVRSRCCEKILYQHGTIQLLNGTEIGVDQLYVDVWLLNQPPRTKYVSADLMLKSFDLRNDRLGLGDRIKRNEGMTVANTNSKLLILGKPGAGKTTFLKHLAMDCSSSKFQPDLIPVLIELRRIRSTEWKLLDAISAELKVKDQEQTQKLLEQGKLLILIDGLDEVPTSILRKGVQGQICDLAQESKHSGNRFIITCRTQIIEVIPQGFTSVEVADFNDEQVEKFVRNWFCTSGQTKTEIEQQWQAFAGAIQNNSALKELTVTPVLLSLMCLVLQDAGELPSQAALLYRKGIRLLLEKWNDRKEIPDWEVGTEEYRKLTPEQKEALLTEIAVQKFENSANFVLFEQKDLAKQIARYLNLANIRDGESVLKAIETQHGLLVERADELWSFSHLTFQEHFTAQWLTSLSPNQLTEKLVNQQWQAVIKQLVGFQKTSDRLLRLIKQSIDYSVLQDAKLQEFVTWIQKKAETVSTPYNLAVIREFYFDRALDRNRDFERALDRSLNLDTILNLDRNLDLDLDRTLALTLAIALALTFDRALDLERALNLALNRTLTLTLDPMLVNKLQQLKEQLPKDSSMQNWKNFQHWWMTNGHDWIERLRRIMIEHRDIGHDWQFTKAQKQILKQYYDANKFLIELLKQSGGVSSTVRQEIEDNLLLPIATLRERLPEMYGEL